MTSDARYLLVKRGLYYGPNNQGYTGVKDRAGRYPATDARPSDGIQAVHEDEASEFAPACWQETIIAELRARIEALTAERDAAMKCVEAADKIVATFEPAIADAMAQGEARATAAIVAWLRAMSAGASSALADAIERGDRLTEAKPIEPAAEVLADMASEPRICGECRRFVVECNCVGF